MNIDSGLKKIIYDELGETSAELFVRFYFGFSQDEQIEGAREILRLAVGASRTRRLLAKYLKK